jgi:hypothetical protein
MMKDSVTSFNARDASLVSMKIRDAMSVGTTYLNFLVASVIVYYVFSDASYSGVLTLGAALQCFAFYSLMQRVNRQKSLAGISRKTLEMHLCYLVLRLGTTLHRSGYLPVDRSGDFVYQAADLASLGIVFHLLTLFYDPTLRKTYQDEHDSMDVYKALPGCILVAIFVHGHLSDHFFFDTLWQASTNVDTIAMIPQLWMMSSIGGEVDGMTSHFVVAISLSRLCSFAFWFYGYKELRRGNAPNIAGGLLIMCHFTQCVFSADFLYYYLRARVQGKRLTLPGL